MLFTRFLTAIVLLLIAGTALYFEGVPLQLLAGLVYACIQFEILAFGNQIRGEVRNLLTFFSFALPAGFLIAGPLGLLAGLAFYMLCGFSLIVIEREADVHEQSAMDSLCILGLSASYTGLLGSILLALTVDAPRSYLLWLLAIVITTDTAAFFVGRSFGRRKLAPRVSPKKSVEGALGGVFFAVLVGYFLGHYLGIARTTFSLIMISALASILAVLGDLAESLLKRSFNRKDSSSILPGHGGVLDRVDALLFVAPLVYFFLTHSR